MALYKRDIEDIKRLRNSATRKLSRIDRKEGLNLRSTKYDPRLPIGAEKSMSRKEINQYKKALSAFNDRNNQYVRGKGHPVIERGRVVGRQYAVLSKQNITAYRRAVREAQKAADQYYSRFHGITTSLGETTEQYMSGMKTIHNLTSSVNSPELQRPKMSFGTVTSDKALEELTKEYKHRAKKGFYGGENAWNHKQQILRMMETGGDKDQEKALRELSLDQIEYIYNYEPNFMANLSIGYEAAMKDYLPEWQANQIEDSKRMNIGILNRVKYLDITSKKVKSK